MRVFGGAVRPPNPPAWVPGLVVPLVVIAVTPRRLCCWRVYDELKLAPGSCADSVMPSWARAWASRKSAARRSRLAVASWICISSSSGSPSSFHQYGSNGSATGRLTPGAGAAAGVGVAVNQEAGCHQASGRWKSGPILMQPARPGRADTSSTKRMIRTQPPPGDSRWRQPKQLALVVPRLSCKVRSSSRAMEVPRLRRGAVGADMPTARRAACPRS